jgi:MSHA pilin protein MshA
MIKPSQAMGMKLTQESGFTLIELIIVMIIVGILAAIITPKFIHLEDEALVAAKAGLSGAVKSAWAVAIAGKKDFPTVTELADYVHGGSALAAGIQVEIKGDLYTVPTYKGNCKATPTACETASSGGDPCVTTGDVSDLASCVASIV